MRGLCLEVHKAGERQTYTLNINYRGVSAIIKVTSKPGNGAAINEDNRCKGDLKRKTGAM
jgi:hypothetical protein